jgi:hypothetical protein
VTVDRRRTVIQATRRALEVRKRLGVALEDPICAVDFAERLELDVWFADVPSMEGIYQPGRRLILLSSLRPAGRQAFTCAHEIAHDEFGDGQQFDELVDGRTEARRHDPVEFRAEAFAGELLMPKTTVALAFKERGADPCTCAPETFYAISCWLGVGYATLVHHSFAALHLIHRTRRDELLRVRLPQMRQRILGVSCAAHLLVLDLQWRSRAADMQVGDCLVLPAGADIEGGCARVLDRRGALTIAEAVQPGLGRVAVSDWSAFIRISRKAYIGRARFRFDEEEDASDN